MNSLGVYFQVNNQRRQSTLEQKAFEEILDG
jgi:hypothetical protein